MKIQNKCKVLTMLGILILSMSAVTNAAVDRGAWDNTTQWIDDSFLAQSPTSSDYIWAMYGTDAAKNTKYNVDWNTRSCTPSTMSVVYVNSGSNTIPNNLAANTIYVLAPGKYINTYRINMATCSAILGKGDIWIYSTTQVSAGDSDAMVMANAKSNVIIQGIKVNGESNGTVGTHARNINGIGLYSVTTSSTIYDCTAIKSKRNMAVRPYGVGIEVGAYNQLGNYYAHVEKIRVEDADYGFTMSANRSSLRDGSFYNFDQAGVSTYLADYNLFENISTSGSDIGVYIYTSNYNTGKDINAYSNSGMGILITNTSNNNVIIDSKLHHNGYSQGPTNTAGIFIGTLSINNLIENTDIYQNEGQGGIIFESENATANNRINNSRVYNNNTFGIRLGTNSNGNTINNTIMFNNRDGIFNYLSYNNSFNNCIIANNGLGAHVYANGNIFNNTLFINNDVGLSLDGRGGNGFAIINNSKFVNNTASFGFSSAAGTVTYYGENKFINNGATGAVTLTQGTDGFNGLGLTNGTLVPNTVSTNQIFKELLNLQNANKIMTVGANSCAINQSYNYGRDPTAGNIKYWLGANLATQKAPYRFATTWQASPLSWNASTKIGQTAYPAPKLVTEWSCLYNELFTITSQGSLFNLPKVTTTIPKATPIQVTFSWENIGDYSYKSTILEKLVPSRKNIQPLSTGALVINLRQFKSSPILGNVE